MTNPIKDMLTQIFMKFDKMIFMSKIIPFMESTFLSIGIVLYLDDYFVLMIPDFWLILMCFAISLLLLIINLNSKEALTYIVLVGIGIFILFLIRMMKIDLDTLIKDLYAWWMTYYGEPKDYHKGFSYLTSLLIIFVVCSILHVLHKLVFTRYVFALSFPILLLIASINGIEIEKISIGLILLYTIWVLVEVLGRIYLKDITKEANRLATLYLAPVYATMIFFVILLPSKAEPIQWSGVKNIISLIEEQGIKVNNYVRYILNPDNRVFKFSIAGYQDEEENELGGSMSFYDKTSLSITTYSKTTQKGYLIGSIYDIYTGSSWVKSENKDRKSNNTQSYYDYLELLNVFGREYEKGTNLENLVAKRYYSISYEDIRTKTLFYPLKTFEITPRKQSQYKETSLANQLFQSAKGTGYTYKVDFYELNLSSEIFKDILRSEDIAYVNNDETINYVSKTIFSNKKIEPSKNITALKDELTLRREEIYKQYTKLPDTITNRTKELAFEISKGYGNDYDRLRAIEQFLSNYDYTTKVSKPPADRDFVDYFLFDEKEGYCTYYATAMCVLARINNIPTRYVEGFVVDYSPSGEDNVYDVKNDNAHAWVEAYIKGIGWIPFEPTIPYSNGRYTIWSESKNEFSYDIGDFEYDRDYRMEGIYDSLNNLGDESSIPASKDLVGAKIKELYGIIRIILLLVTFILIITLTILLYYLMLENRYKKIIRNRDDSIKLRILLAELFMYLKLDGYKISNDETLLTFSERIGDRIKFYNTTFYELVLIYQEIRYGDKPLNNTDYSKFLDFINEYRLEHRRKIGKFKMFFHRFIYLNSKYE